MNIDKLKQVIQKANPSIREVKFGCEVKYPDYSNRVQVIEKDEDKIWVREADKDNCFGKVEKVDTDEIEILGRPIRLDDTALVVGDKHYLIDNWKIGNLDDQEPNLIEWILKNLKNT